MKITLLAFGSAKDIFGNRKLEIELAEQSTTANLKALLNSQYPALQKLAVYRIAVNDEYSSENVVIKENDEVAIIPPVSGG